MSGKNNYQPCLTAHFAWELTRRRAAAEEDRISRSLFDASVDLIIHPKLFQLLTRDSNEFTLYA